MRVLYSALPSRAFLGISLLGLVVAPLPFLVGCKGSSGCRRAVLSAKFERDPIPAGWTGVASPSQPFEGSWTAADACSGKHSVVSRHGGWESPMFRVQPFQLYRVSFWSRSERKAYWLVRSFEAQGKESRADHYSSIYPSENWVENEFYFTGRADSAWARLSFRPIDAELRIDEVRVRPASREEALRWADQLQASLPPLNYQPAPDRLKFLERTMRKLGRGPVLRIVVLGDSIANDTSNSLFDLLLERRYPNVRIEVIRSIRGGTGCWYFQHENRVKELVVDHRPDLVIIAGISHGNDPEPIRNVIRQVREARETDILVLSGAIIETGLTHYWHTRGGFTPEARAAALAQSQKFRAKLREMAEEEKVAFLDVRGIWNHYVEQSPQPLEWYQRDWVHANTRGKHVLARILERFFSVDAPSDR